MGMAIAIIVSLMIGTFIGVTIMACLNASEYKHYNKNDKKPNQSEEEK